MPYRLLTDDVNSLSESATAGNLHIRVDVNRHQGSYAMLVKGMNETLDAVVGPIEEAMRVAGNMPVVTWPLPLTPQCLKG